MEYNEYIEMQKIHHETKEAEDYYSKSNYVKMAESLRTLIPQNIQKMLEIGCNTGYESLFLKRFCSELISIDISEFCVDKAKEWGINAITMDMHQLIFENDIFDCVYANNVLEHAIYPNVFLSEVYRVLKKNGVFIFAIPEDGVDCGKTKEEIINLSNGWNPDLHVFKTTQKELREILVKHKFEIDVFEQKDMQKEFGMSHIPSNNTMLFGRVRKNE